MDEGIKELFGSFGRVGQSLPFLMEDRFDLRGRSGFFRSYFCPSLIRQMVANPVLIKGRQRENGKQKKGEDPLRCGLQAESEISFLSLVFSLFMI